MINRVQIWPCATINTGVLPSSGVGVFVGAGVSLSTGMGSVVCRDLVVEGHWGICSLAGVVVVYMSAQVYVSAQVEVLVSVTCNCAETGECYRSAGLVVGIARCRMKHLPIQLRDTRSLPGRRA
jgi:hypothetical protein